MPRLPALALLSVVALAACQEEPPQNEDGCTGEWFAPFLRAGEPTTADLSCLPEEGPTDAPLLDPACAGTASLEGKTVDHESSDPAGEIALEVFFDDAVDDSPDLSLTSGASGQVTGDVPVCSPLPYVPDRGAGGEARVTRGQHVIVKPGAPATFDFRSVKESTVGLITLFLGVEVEEGKGIVFGKAAGCDGATAVDRVQVLVRDADCRVPEGFAAGYTTNRVPDAFISSTSTDGFFFAMNIPPGEWTLEAYVQDGDSFRLVGSSPVVVAADQVELADVQIGRSDGIVVPEECRGGC